MPVDLDARTRAILATLAADGIVVSVGRDDHGRVVVEARDAAGETCQVWAADAFAARGHRISRGHWAGFGA